jgi:hypothetical protein
MRSQKDFFSALRDDTSGEAEMLARRRLVKAAHLKSDFDSLRPQADFGAQKNEKNCPTSLRLDSPFRRAIFIKSSSPVAFVTIRIRLQVASEKTF